MQLNNFIRAKSKRLIPYLIRLEPYFLTILLQNTGKEIYILTQEDGPFLLEDKEDSDGEISTVLPVWCHEEYAQKYVELAALSNTAVQKVTAKAWNENWISFLKEQNILIGIMPIDENTDFEIEEPEEI
ncbi:MAG TPA: hypothetical protein DCR21_00325 [Succinivibrionaceae bacterium]|nr:hypothetical protein [Succinivibrionaceae bacterium]